MALLDYQAALGGVTIGEGTSYHVGFGGIQGLGNPAAKTADFDVDLADGAFGGPDFLGVRTILIPIEISEVDDATAFTSLSTLKVAWMPTSANIALNVKLPGHDEVLWNGRPRELEADLGDVHDGVIHCIAHFEALDPTAQDA